MSAPKRPDVPPETLRAVTGAAVVQYGLCTEGRMVIMYLLSVSLGYGMTSAAAALKLKRTYAPTCCHTIEDRRDDASFDDVLSELEASLMHLKAPELEAA